MTAYSGQTEQGEIELIAGENKGLVFTETDRTMGRRAVESGEPAPFPVVARLFDLMQAGSIQAQYFFEHLPQETFSDDYIDAYMRHQAPRDSSGLVSGYDDFMGRVMQARAIDI